MASSAWASTAVAAVSASEACVLISCSASSRVPARRSRVASSLSRARARAIRPWLAAAAQAAWAAAMPSWPASAAAMSAGGRLANASVRERDGIVPSSASTLRATSTNTTPGCGSSKTLSRALAAASVMRSASSRMNTATGASWWDREASSRTARMSSTRRLSPSGTIRWTSGWTPRRIRRQTSQVPSPPPGQLRAAAKTFATWSLPTPGGPRNSQAWATRSLATASRRVATAAAWPATRPQTDAPATSGPPRDPGRVRVPRVAPLRMAEALQDGAADRGGDLLDRQGGVDHGEPLGVLGGQQHEPLLDQPMELQVFDLDPVDGGVSPPCPGEPVSRVEPQQHHQVRLEAAGGEVV